MVLSFNLRCNGDVAWLPKWGFWHWLAPTSVGANAYFIVPFVPSGPAG